MSDYYIKPTSDIFIHYIFGSEKNKNLLLSFVNAVLEDSGFSPIADAIIQNPFNIKNFPVDKASILDVKLKDEKGRLYNLEVQSLGNRQFIKRSLYYWSKVYSSQLENKGLYDSLHPVICINILEFIAIQGIERAHSCFMPLEKDHTDIQIVTIHLILKSYNFTL